MNETHKNNLNVEFLANPVVSSVNQKGPILIYSLWEHINWR